MRRTRINAGAAMPTDPRWVNPTIVFREAATNKEVVLTIESPWELVFLRNQLTKIANHWKDSVKDI